jgi:phenylacetate-CoA ligase
MRRSLRRGLLGIDALDIYGLTEICGPGVSYECLEKTGMHVNEDHVIPEINRPCNRAAAANGTPGELVFTTITKEGQPCSATAPMTSAPSITTPAPAAEPPYV